ncbi:MAG TPA: diacylglycerol kinase family protein [Tepidisphaeraceae bacterium]|nr:diacylglycerol kinase family protein [Tepidisphaeraceae bacterium]
MHQRIAIFANPIAGRGKGRRLAESLAERFRRESWDARVVLDHPLKAAPEVTADITAAVSIGGDGTLRSVVERVTDHGANEGPGVMVVPMGTANLMGRHLGVALSIRGLEERAVAALKRDRIVHLDTGVVRTAPADGGAPVRRLFLLMVGVGIDGAIVHALDRVRRGPIGIASYFRPAFETLAGYAYPRISVEVDGRSVWAMRQGVCWVGNVKEYGTGFEILPHARSDDGVLDVCIMPARSPGELINHFMTAALGEHVHGEGVVYTKGCKVRVTADRPVELQADGDPAGFTPAEMELSTVRVGFIAP